MESQNIDKSLLVMGKFKDVIYDENFIFSLIQMPKLQLMNEIEDKIFHCTVANREETIKWIEENNKIEYKKITSYSWWYDTTISLQIYSGKISNLIKQKPIIDVIINDSLDRLLNYSSDKEYMSKISGLCAEAGAVECFKYLYLNDYFIINNEIAETAIKGGNEEIIQFCEQYGANFDYLINEAVSHHHNHIIPWLQDNYRQDEISLDTVLKTPNTLAYVYYYFKNVIFFDDLYNFKFPAYIEFALKFMDKNQIINFLTTKTYDILYCYCKNSEILHYFIEYREYFDFNVVTKYCLILNYINVDFFKELTDDWKIKLNKDIYLLFVENGKDDYVQSIINSQKNECFYLSLFDSHQELFKYALIKKSLPLIKFIIENKYCDVNERFNVKNRTPLMIAAKGDEKIVEYLLSKGALVNLQDDNGNIALHYAVSHPSFWLLLENGSDYKICDNNGNNSIAITILQKNPYNFGLIIKKLDDYKIFLEENKKHLNIIDHLASINSISFILELDFDKEYALEVMQYFSLHSKAH